MLIFDLFVYGQIAWQLSLYEYARNFNSCAHCISDVWTKTYYVLTRFELVINIINYTCVDYDYYY